MGDTYRRGFTLLEVMIALVIFSITAMVLLQQASRSVTQISYLEKKQWSIWAAENTMEEIRIDNAFPTLGTKNQKIQLGQHEWDIATEVSSTSDKQLRRVDISVSLSSEDSPTTTLTGFIGEH